MGFNGWADGGWKEASCVSDGAKEWKALLFVCSTCNREVIEKKKAVDVHNDSGGAVAYGLLEAQHVVDIRTVK